MARAVHIYYSSCGNGAVDNRMENNMGQNDRPHVAQAIASVMGDIGRVPRRGRNQHHGYDYATEADLVEAVRAGLATRGVIMIPTVRDAQVVDRAGPRGAVQVARVTVDYLITDGVTEIRASSVGEAIDRDAKGIFAAITGAHKYMICKLFLVPTGDDPESVSEHDATRGAVAHGASTPPPAAAPKVSVRDTGTAPTPVGDSVADVMRRGLAARMAEVGLAGTARDAWLSMVTGRAVGQGHPRMTADEIRHVVDRLSDYGPPSSDVMGSR